MHTPDTWPSVGDTVQWTYRVGKVVHHTAAKVVYVLPDPTRNPRGHITLKVKKSDYERPKGSPDRIIEDALYHPDGEPGCWRPTP